MRSIGLTLPNALVAVTKDMQAVKLHQQKPPVLNAVDLYNGHKTGGWFFKDTIVVS